MRKSEMRQVYMKIPGLLYDHDDDGQQVFTAHVKKVDFDWHAIAMELEEAGIDGLSAGMYVDEFRKRVSMMELAKDLASRMEEQTEKDTL